MKKRTLGTTTLSITPIALGTMQFLWTTTEKESLFLLDTYYAAGGNFIDTADMYTQWISGGIGGEAETIIGKWLNKRKNRHDIILASKVRSRMWEGEDGEGLSRKHIIKACDDSLKRLQTEYLDLYFSHWPDEKTPEEETLLAYQELISQGKIRFVGCSNYSSDQLKNSLELKQKGLPTYSVIQALYNLIDRNEFENNLLPLVKEHDISVLAYSPLASGFLSGLYKTGNNLPTNARAKFATSKMTEKNLKSLSVVEELAKKHRATVAQISLAWLLRKKSISGLITGADNSMQLHENLGALRVNLTSQDMTELDRLT